MIPSLLEINFEINAFKPGLLALLTGFVTALLLMPALIKLINRFHLFDVPDKRKEHLTPVPTMGGIAVWAGMSMACILWLPMAGNNSYLSALFFAVAVLLGVGIMDDLKNLNARYKLVIQLSVASLLAFSGIRIQSFNGLLGIYDLPVFIQYLFTIVTIAGITNAYNLIDGIDGLAGGLGFMSVITLGLFLTFSNDQNDGIIAFALSGGLLGFLYYNFNPARIFMGDTGSLFLGFVISVLSIRLIQLNTGNPVHVIPHAPVFALSIVAIPVFDTLRVFAIRIGKGKSPFSPDKNHIHHLLTNNGWDHQFTTKMICAFNAVLLVAGYFLKGLPQFAGILVLLCLLLLMVYIFQRLSRKPIEQS